MDPKKHKDVNNPNPTKTSSSAALTIYKNVIVPSISAANFYFRFQAIFNIINLYIYRIIVTKLTIIKNIKKMAEFSLK
jgi:hypothetical protein